MKKTKFGRWFPFNPFPMSMGTSLLNYVFDKKQFDAMPIECIKDALDRTGFDHPTFYRINKIFGIDYIEFMCIK